MEYHKKNRERYLEYMRSYNRLYWLIKRPEKPKKEKPVKPPKEPKPPKPPKVAKEKKPYKVRPPKENEWFVVPEPNYPTRIEHGNFVLEF
jgi:hypothetical protein